MKIFTKLLRVKYAPDTSRYHGSYCINVIWKCNNFLQLIANNKTLDPFFKKQLFNSTNQVFSFEDRGNIQKKLKCSVKCTLYRFMGEPKSIWLPCWLSVRPTLSLLSTVENYKNCCKLEKCSSQSIDKTKCKTQRDLPSSMPSVLRNCTWFVLKFHHFLLLLLRNSTTENSLRCVICCVYNYAE